MIIEMYEKEIIMLRGTRIISGQEALTFTDTLNTLRRLVH